MLTITIIVVTSVVSIVAFGNRNLMNALIFFPPAIGEGRQWFRLFSYGTLHANWAHLFFNMFTFYLFGSAVEGIFKSSLGAQAGSVCYLLLYITALPVSILPSYFEHRNNFSYYGVGASGAVAAVVFAYVLMNPMNFMGIVFIPVFLPAFLFALIFVIVSVYLDKRQSVGINHLAHVAGGVYGLAYSTAVFLALGGINLISHFFSQIRIESLSNLIHFGF